jgi:hypothetical protein
MVMPPTLPDRVLAVVNDRPGVSVTELRQMVKGVSGLGLLTALNELRLCRKIQNTAAGRYKAVDTEPPVSERLMAGR